MNVITHFYKNDGTETDMDNCDYCRIELKGPNAKKIDAHMLISKHTIGLVSCYEWYLGKDGYPVSYRCIDTKQNLGHGIRIHRLLMEDPKGMVVDHINNNKLDNRMNNLRICTAKENSYNTKKRTNNYKGVKKISKDSYSAIISKDGKTREIKNIPTAKQAAQIYDMMAEELFGVFAGKNYIA